MALRNNSNPMAGKPAGNFVYCRFKLSFPSTANESTGTRLPVDGRTRICRILNFWILLKRYFLVPRKAEPKVCLAYRWIMPRRTAMVIAWVRSLAPSFSIICWT